MLDSKFFITLAGLIVVVVAICNTNTSSFVSEGFSNNNSNKVQREHVNNLSNKQGTLSPCFSTFDNENIKYNYECEKQASPQDLIAFSNMVNNNYNIQGNCSSGCDSVVPEKTKLSNEIDKTISETAEDLAGIGDMNSLNNVQNVVYERNIFAIKKNRLRGNADLIRGDLHIVPDNTSSWFNVHGKINDLHSGAMNVMGGVCNETSNSLSKAKYKNSNGLESNLGGYDLSDYFKHNEL